MNPTKDYGAVLRGMADAALESAFGAEWINLESPARRLVLADFLDASEEDNVSVLEYARRIGTGNLEAYGRMMIARANDSRPWEQG